MSTQPTIIVRRPTGAAERDEIFRLRYAVFAEELNWGMPDEAHRSGLCTDPDDETAELYGAYLGAALVGTVRWNRVGDSVLTTLKGLLETAGFTNPLSPSGAVASRLAVAPAWRGTPTALRILSHAVCDGLREGIDGVYMYTRPSIWRFYEGLGFRRFVSGLVDHPDLGPQAIGHLDLTSPSTMRRIALAYGRRGGTAAGIEDPGPAGPYRPDPNGAYERAAAAYEVGR
jgi:GNAT superfamily N-acetyltransferase